MKTSLRGLTCVCFFPFFPFLFAVQELSKDGLQAEPPPLLADILDLHICVILH